MSVHYVFYPSGFVLLFWALIPQLVLEVLDVIDESFPCSGRSCHLVSPHLGYVIIVMQGGKAAAIKCWAPSAVSVRPREMFGLFGTVPESSSPRERSAHQLCKLLIF